MRRRRRPPAGVVTRLQGLDFFSKVEDECKVRTRSGGVISLFSLATIVCLFLSELSNYLVVEVVDHIVVDTLLKEKLAIGVNITFPSMRCDEVSVDTVDAQGHSQVNARGALAKSDLDHDGRFVPSPRAVGGSCLPCLEAGDYNPSKCCNTCQELKDAYTEVGLPYYHLMDTAQQCRDLEGCQVHGDVLVSKVGGNVHVALGRSVLRDGRHVHEFNLKEVGDGFNTSHTIHRLDFGQVVEGMLSPLEGSERVVKRGAYMFYYYIQLVPTLFTREQRFGWGTETVYTHQYSASGTAKNVLRRRGKLKGLPGVFFVYEFAPFMVQKRHKVMPLSHFLTSVCAIIGGVFTVAGMIDSLLYRSYTGLKQAGAAKLRD